jgi:hypothetical protein
MAGATKARARGRTGPVAARMQELREQAERDPIAARDEAWDWIEQLGGRATTDRDGALNELQELFLSGEPATGISGQTEGLLVTWTINPTADRVISQLTNAWMPWLGKKFDPEQHRGINTLTGGARWPAKLLWPFYATREDPLGRAGFEFTTYVESGLLDPSVNVLVIDYASVPENPRLLVRQIRDELVQIVPGANLGKMLVKMPRRTEPVLGLYFALRPLLRAEVIA